MGRKLVWPPTVYVRKGVEYVKLPGPPRRQVTLGPAGSAEARSRYLREVARAEANGRRAPLDPEGLAVAALVRRYTDLQAGAGPHVRWRVRTALGPAVALYGDTPAASFGPLALQAVRAEWVSYGYARTLCNKLADTLRRCWKWGVAQELVPAATLLALRAVEGLRRGKTSAPERPKVGPADPAAVAAAKKHMPRAVRDMVELQLLTGMRPGEVCRLRPRHVDRDWKALDGTACWLYRMGEHKTADAVGDKAVPLGPRARRLLAPYLKGDPDARCFAPPRPKPGREPGYGPDTYAQAVRQACAAAGVAPWRPNQLRHLAATLIEAAEGREAARCALGHASPQMTARYAEWLETAARVAAKHG